MSTQKANKATKATAPKAEQDNIKASKEDNGGTPEQPIAAPEPEAPIVDEPELSEHEQELNRRIDPSQPMVDPGAESQVVDTETEQADQLSDQALEQLSKFSELYPQNKVFHFTSDGQMFLDANKQDAETHEKTIDGAGVQSFEVQ